MHSVAIHHPKTEATLPTHERDARHRRAADANFPSILGRKTRQTSNPTQPGRKTADTREYNAPRLF